MVKSSYFLGIDGCQKGWISIALNTQSEWEIRIFHSINEIWSNYSTAEIILIDIPIGLWDMGSIPRLCDKEARKLLTRKRSSSVFPTPCRDVLSAESYEKANEINRTLTSKGLSKQTWNITPKIKDVNNFLQKNKDAQQIIIESHPELCFMALANGEPLTYYKKKEEGITERLNLLTSHFQKSKEILNDGQEKFNKKEVAIDDILDALVLAVSASLGKKNLSFIPEDYEFDKIGLPMRMAIPNFKK
jgi:predicted RNase H-like nuclease